ncbi:hypothetical protein FRB93_006566 [Tulasnella sp. JGI-2019a]|nr:hypothetical protein FRB93_006566 [Tulasnella sp. JGI-2019a]
MAAVVALPTHDRHLEQSVPYSGPPLAASNDSSSTSSNPAPTDVFSISDDELKDRLQFINEIGFGNWGSVWSCYTRNTPTREKVAVKLVHRSKTPTTAARVKSLWNEMKVHRSFRNDSHPSIVSFQSFVITPSFALIVMEYLPRLIPVEVREAKAKPWFESLLGGVHFLHSHGVSHNDIKPANILLTAHSVPVLVDFGFAEYHGVDGNFQSTLAYGTPEYLDPLRAKGLKHDTRLSDIYSLGVTFFEILVGRTPFEEVEGEAFETQEDLEVYWKRTKLGVWLGEREWKKNVSDGLENLLLRMMCPEPSGRDNAVMALSDPYWRTEIATSSKRRGELTPRACRNRPEPATPRAPSPLASPVKKPKTKAPHKEKKSSKKENSKPIKRDSVATDMIRSPTPAKAIKVLGITQPKLSPSVRTSPSKSTVYSSRRPTPPLLKSSASGIPVPKRRPIPSQTYTAPITPSRHGSNKENAHTSRPPTHRANTNEKDVKTLTSSILGVAPSFLSEKYHIEKKTHTRKPISSVFQPDEENAGSSPSARQRVASIVNKCVSSEKTKDKACAETPRQRVASIVNKSAGSEPRKKSLVGQAGKVAREKALKAVRKVEEGMGITNTSPKIPRGEEKGVKKILNQIEPVDDGPLDYPMAALKSKSVLELVKEVKERQRQRHQEQQNLAVGRADDEHPGDASLQTVDPDSSIVVIGDADVSASLVEIDQGLPTPSMAAMSPRDSVFPRSAKSSVSVLRNGIRMSIDKIGKFSSAVGAGVNMGKQSKFSLADVSQDLADSSFCRDENQTQAMGSSTFSRSQPCLQQPFASHDDRMTEWIKSVERVVEETRTNFQNNGEVASTAPTFPVLPPPRRASVTLATAVGSARSAGVVNVKRRATIGADSSMTARSLESDDTCAADEDAVVNRPTQVFKTQQHISSVANLELEMEKTRAPQRLSAVIDPVGLAAEFAKFEAARTSGETATTAVDNPGMLTVLAKSNDMIPSIEVTAEADLASPTMTPVSSMSRAYRNSASTVFLLDRLGPPGAETPQQQCPSSSSLGLGIHPVMPDYDQLLMSSSGVMRLGQGHQSDYSIRRTAQESKPQSADSPQEAQRKKLHRRSFFGKGWGGQSTLEPPATNRRDLGAKSFDDLGAKRNEAALLDVPQRAGGEPESMAGRMKKALQTILSTPRRTRTFTHGH